MNTLIDSIRWCNKKICRVFIKDPHERKVTEIKMTQKALRNPIYRFIDIYIGTVIWTIWALIKFRFDKDRIFAHLTILQKDMKRRHRDAEDENRRVKLELKELEREIAKKEDQLRLFYLMERQRLVDHVKSLKETDKS